MRLTRRILQLYLGCLACMFTLPLSAQSDTRPNILVIVADDLGYSDIGAFGGEISTPNLDSLASQGTRFTNFHVLPSCAPTRAVFLTGVDNHAAGLGSQLPTERQRGVPGYEGHLSSDVTTIPEALVTAGYRTYFSGKWHLGSEENQSPYSRGFQHSFGLLQGGGSHFADATALRPAEQMLYRRNGQIVDRLPDDFYSTEYYTDTLLTWLERDVNDEGPFFAYLAYTAPHDPLHAPANYIEKYRGAYDDGYENLRERRIKALRQQGILSSDIVEPAWPKLVPRWHDLTPEQQRLKSRDMEVYAAMVDYMDEQIGRVVDWLERNNKLDNTLIVFFSDNGANGFAATAYPGHDQTYHEQFDNSFDNRGNQGSFIEMGAGWATASTGIYRLFKAFSTEGGIRTPAIVRLPQGHTAPSISENFVHVSDFMPTFLELAESSSDPQTPDARAKLTGQSILPIFTPEKNGLSPNRGIGYEVNGTRAYIKGDWKILNMPVPMGSGEWELFNLRDDPTESNSLANSHPDKLLELTGLYEQYERDSGVVFDLPGSLGRMNTIFKILTGLIIALCCWPIVRQARNRSRRPSPRENWPALIATAVVVAIGVTLILGPNYLLGAGVLAIFAAFELVQNLYRRKGFLNFAVPVLILIALYLFSYFKSGQSVSMLLG